jgi:stress response protein SCP2
MTLTPTSIYLQKRARVILPEGVPDGHPTISIERTYVATFNRNLNTIGFTMDLELLLAVAKSGLENMVALYNGIFPILKEMTGAHQVHKPMYPNFPKQVMEASAVELYLNAILHYWGSFIHDVTSVPVQYLPDYQKDHREALPDGEIKLRVLRLGSAKDFDSIFGTLVGANAALSQADKDIVTWFVKNRRSEIPTLLPEAIPQKENLAHLFGELSASGTPEYLLPYLKTATDALRVAVVMSGGDVSLAKPTKFRKFKRSERRFFLSVIERASSATEDMLRRPEVFKRFGHGLRAGDYADRFPKAYSAFKVIRNDEDFDTFNSKVESALMFDNVLAAADLLSTRPGDFSRRLDHLLRLEGGVKSSHPLWVLKQYEAIVDQVSTPVLLQAFAHFKNRNNDLGFRAFFPKGNVAKVQVVDGSLPKLGEVSDQAAGIIRAALVRRFAKLPALGPTYLDSRLKTQLVPFSVRSASKSLRTVARGSRIPLPDCSTLRFFIWWKDGESRTDLDLSAAFLDDDFKFKTAVTYYNLREMGAHHSGDITSAPNGASEFIDIDISKARKHGRYVVMVVNSFTQQPFKDLPECFAGWMARSKVQSGEVFDARTVQDKIDVTAETKVSVPIVFDLQERVAIWADLSLNSAAAINNVGQNRVGISQMAKAISTLQKPALYDLFEMHIEARGKPVLKEEAETIFSLYEGITPFDQDRILKDFLA